MGWLDGLVDGVTFGDMIKRRAAQQVDDEHRSD
jgi:hypothetical protein